MQADIVALGVELAGAYDRNSQVLRDPAIHMLIAGDHAHLKRLRPADDLASHASQSEYPEGFPAKLGSHEALLFPLAALGGSDGLGYGSRHGNHQPESMLRHGHGISAGRIHDQDASTRGRVQIHIVHADTGPSHHSQTRSFRQQIRVHFYRATHQERVGVRQVRHVILGIGDDHVPSGLCSQQVKPCLRHWLGHQYLHCRLKR